MSYSTHQIQNLLKQESLHIPELYHFSSKKFRYDSERLDSYRALIQQKLWEINSEKSRIAQLFTSLDKRWHKLDRDEADLQEMYSQIQVEIEIKDY